MYTNKNRQTKLFISHGEPRGTVNFLFFFLYSLRAANARRLVRAIILSPS